MGNQESSEPTHWSVKAAARYLGIAPSTLYSWLDSDRIATRGARLIGNKPPHKRFGRNCIRLPIVEFKNWVENYNATRKP